MDKRTTFADGLTFPNGVMPWRGGLIVTCAPEVLFFKDNDGDGRADEEKVLLTGFATSGSTQLRVNCPTLGPDGWIYFAAGLSGGNITSPGHPERPALKMTGDLRWQPFTGEIENVDGRSQYGMSFDDYGRRFICMNRVPVQHVVLSSKILARNPHLAFSETVQDCSERTVKTGLRGGGDGVRLFPISHNITTADSHAGSFSAACGIMIWRGGALPERYNGCAFTCDPTGNLVHVDRLEPRGATFTAVSMFESEQREFLASRDDWFRPVFLTGGPDGALYVCDMYRKTIEHPDYLPEEVRKRTDFESGKEMGRIWRVKAAEKSTRQTKRHSLVSDSDIRKRFTTAIELGNVNTPASTAELARIAARDADDRWTRAAVLSGIDGRVINFQCAFRDEIKTVTAGTLDLLMNIGRLASDGSAPLDQKQLTDLIGPVSGRHAFNVTTAVLVGLAEASGKRITPKPETLSLEVFVGTAQEIARDNAQTSSRRELALRFLARCPWPLANDTLRNIATTEPNVALRATAIRALAGFDEPEVESALLDRDYWRAATPELRETVLSALLTSPTHFSGVLAAVENGTLSANAFSPQRRTLFLKHKEPAIRDRAEKLFGTASAGDRQKAFEDAKAALALAANGEHGSEIFKMHCAICHRLEREGVAVGPDLLDIRNQPKESILFHVVVPDAEITPAFAAYLAETKDGRAFSGILVSETATSVQLRMPGGAEETLLRANLTKFEALPNSLMPAGLEAAMSRQDLGDLLAFLKGER